jgi:hypothetical protein
MLETHVRDLTKSERRLLQSNRRNVRHKSRGRALVVTGVAVFGTLWLLTLAASEISWPIVTAFWLVAGTGIMLWVRHDAGKNDARLDAMGDQIDSSLRANTAKIFDVKATAFVAFEEVEDEGACYVFELADNTLLCLSGQQYYETAKFPSLDFSLVQILDEDGRIVDEWIQKRGPKAAPVRVIPASAKWNMELPNDQQTITGRLGDLEDLLGARSGGAV